MQWTMQLQQNTTSLAAPVLMEEPCEAHTRRVASREAGSAQHVEYMEYATNLFMHQHRLFIWVVYMSTAFERTYLVYRHQSASRYVVERCRYSYIASDIYDKRFCLKDSWRPYEPEPKRPEHLGTNAHVGLGCGSSRGAPVWMDSK